MTDIKSASQHIDIDWYRVPVEKTILQELNTRSNMKGLAQAVGHLALLVLTGGLTIYSAGRGAWSWLWVPLLLLVHCSFFHFLLNGFHELCHSTVFASRRLNDFFLKVYSLVSWHNYVLFQQSHRRHHRYTLHPPYDSEVTLPIRHSRKGFLQFGLINPWFWQAIREHTRHARGILLSPWLQKLFPESKPELRRQLFGWARLTLLVHGLIVIASVLLGVFVSPRWLLLPFLTTFARVFGQGLNFLLNATQHVGLSDNVPDFRLCARTFLVNPFFGFLYWQMQYHIEHHMYAAVPFYNLPRLHRLIRHQLPEPTRGIIATWRQIGSILARQKTDPDYTYRPPLPESTNASA